MPLYGKIGKECEIRPPFYCDRGYNIELGDYVFANYHFTVLDGAKVQIGNHVYIAPNVSIYTAGHPFDVVLRRKGLEYARPVRIGDDVWIGGGVSILPGVTIGNNVVIGAGSVVNRDIPDNSLAVGNPCKVIRRLDSSDRYELLIFKVTKGRDAGMHVPAFYVMRCVYLVCFGKPVVLMRHPI